MMDIKQRLLMAFDAEHREHLAKMRAHIDRWFQSENSEAVMDETISDAFCSAHSLKGASRVVDLKTVMEVAHRLESLFALLQTKKRQLRPELEGPLRDAFDMIEDITAASKAGQPLPDPKDVLLSLQAAIDNTPLPARAAQEQKVPPTETKTPAPAISLAPDPPPPAVASAKAVERPGASGFDTLRLSSEHVDRLMKTTGEVINFSRNQEEKTEQLRDIAKTLRAMEKEWAAVQKHSIKFLKSMNQNADLLRITKYLSFVESETRALGRRLRGITLEQKNNNLSLRLLGEMLQEDVQSARLIPASDVLEGFGKMMRDLAKDEGKTCEFRMVGLDKGADRAVLQALKDPLMHILRNSLSHGIERPEERQRAGKSASGRIVLQLEVVSRQLLISVSDDGRGIDLEKVRSKIVEKGLCGKDKSARLSTEELRAYLFHPGFSTTSQVTEVAGRGIGLSVVRENVQKLQGEIAIESKVGQGCTFTLSVPLRLATSRLMLLECQGQTFALPTSSMQSVHRVKKTAIANVEGRTMVRVQESFIPLHSLSQLLQMSHTAVQAHQDSLNFCVIKQGDKRLALAVDTLIGEREGLIKELGQPLQNSKRFSGGVLLERGAIALVINPRLLFESSHGGGSGVLEVEHRAETAPRLRILVVDDSFTTRILEKSILEAMGYWVDIATDGMEALNFLQSNDVNLIISDVEMPRMDGFTLLQNVRSHARLKTVPMIMVSSRNEREDQEKGLRLGADAYLPKQEFSQETLLETIKQVL